MPKPGSQAKQPRPGWWNRQESVTKLLIACLSAVIVLLIVAVALVATLGNNKGGAVASASSTTLGSVAETSTTATTTAAASSTTVTTATAESSTTETTTASGSSTTTTTGAPASSTTTVTATSDTADHAADYRAQHPSTESFTNSNWATLNQAPDSHLGAAVDVIGRLSGGPTIDSDTGYLTWHLSIPAAGGTELQALCRTNVNLDRNLLSTGGWVEVRGIAVGAQTSGASGGVAVYVETVKSATAPATTPTT
jgi:hypothetical protein